MADGAFYTITHSKVQVFLHCKKRFWFQFLSGHQWPPEAMNPPGIVGTGVHEAMRVLCETDDPELGRGALDRYLRMPAHESASEGTDWRRLAFELYEKGAVIHTSLGTPDAQRWAEKTAEFKHPAGGIVVRSKIDRIDRIGEDRWQIIDWKTGRFDQDEVTDAQLDLAHLALRSSLNRLVKREHTVRALAVNLRSPELPRVRELRRDDAADTLRYYTNFAAQMQANTDWTPTPGPFCNYCRWRPQCPEGNRDDHADYLDSFEDDEEEVAES